MVDTTDLLNRVIRHAVAAGAFDDHTPLWYEVAAYANLDPETGNDLPLIEQFVKAPAPPTFVQRMYALTNDFHIRTGLKVRITDIYDTFFVTNIAGVEEEDQPGFERAVRARLEEQHSGWQSLPYPKAAK